MDPISDLLQRFEGEPDREAIIWRDQSYSYGWLLDQIGKVKCNPSDKLEIFYGDFTPESIAELIALLQAKKIIAPLSRSSKPTFDEEISILTEHTNHPLIVELQKDEHPGLIIFSSGTTGKRKAILHDANKLLQKFQLIKPRHQRVLAFMLFDHIGGLDTLFYTLFNLGTVICLEDRQPESVFRALEKHKGELLPTSPSFLQLALATYPIENHDLSSLKKIAYGSESMPSPLLQKLHTLFPKVKLTQTYGMSETGVFSSYSKKPTSSWMQIGGENLKTRCVDGILQIKSDTFMLGCLNDETVMTKDGWFVTGDRVEEKGDEIRILGRESDLINVGGEKVNPLEVEEILIEIEGIADALVYGEPNLLMGNVVVAKLVKAPEIEEENLLTVVRKHCLSKLPKYAVPVKFEIEPFGRIERIKKPRTQK